MVIEMKKITVFVGDIDSSLADLALKHNPAAKLITSGNYKKLTAGTYYTSLGDLKDLTEFTDVLRQADIIIYAPPITWSDYKNNNSYMKIWTERYLENFYTIKQIKGFDPIAQPVIDPELFIKLEDYRKTENPQLWIVGCSFSYGFGVEPSQRYGQLIANELDLPVSFLTKRGTSIQWAADQILRSDIRPGDTVVWGLTSSNRFAYFHNGKILEILTSAYVRNPELNKIVDINRLDLDDLLYHNVLSIFQVVNFCNKLGIKLIIANLLGDTLGPYLINRKEFISLIDQVSPVDKLLDYGTDNSHPGPLTHKYYSEQILKKINE